MKTLLAVLMMSGMMTAGPAVAGDNVLKVNVPFEFVAAGAQMPAGDYLFVQDLAQGAMTIRAQDGSKAIRAVFHPGDSNKTGYETAVCFRQIGGTLVLEQVWKDNGSGVKFGNVKVEKGPALAAIGTRTLPASLVR